MTISVRKLAELASGEDGFRDGPFGSNLKTEHYTSSGARVIRLQNIGEGEFVDGDKAYVSLAHYETIKAHSAVAGDIIVACLGDGRRAAGRACILPDLGGPAVVKADCFRVRMSDAVCAAYIVEYLNSAAARQQFASQLRGATRPRITIGMLKALEVALPPLNEQRRIVAALNKRRALATQSQALFQVASKECDRLLVSSINDVLSRATEETTLADCLTEVKEGAGDSWRSLPLLGATRSGLAAGKEAIGSKPERYRRAQAGSVFYNPMRILIGSIALVDAPDEEGLVSPDYVLVRPVEGRMTARFLYAWLRSEHGRRAIRASAKGAVRERMMFRSLAKIALPQPKREDLLKFDLIFAAIKRATQRIQLQLNDLGALDSAMAREALKGSLH